MNYYNQSSFLLFINMLHNSCNVFSSSLFDNHYLSLVNYVCADQNNINIDQFVNFLEQWDLSIPNDNNLGEIKLYTMSQLFQLITQNIYIFCSDDRNEYSTLTEPLILQHGATIIPVARAMSSTN